MLDIKLIRQRPEEVRAALARRGADEGGAAAGLDRVIELDGRRRALIPQLEELRARRNAAADAIALAKRSGEDAAAAIAEQRELGAGEKAWRRSSPPWRPSSTRRCCRYPTCPTRPPPPARRTSWCGSWGRSGWVGSWLAARGLMTLA